MHLTSHGTATKVASAARPWATPGNLPASRRAKLHPLGRSQVSLTGLRTSAGSCRVAPRYGGPTNRCSRTADSARGLVHRASTWRGSAPVLGRDVARRFLGGVLGYPLNAPIRSVGDAAVQNIQELDTAQTNGIGCVRPTDSLPRVFRMPHGGPSSEPSRPTLTNHLLASQCQS